MTYNIKLNLSKLYRFHSSREPECESKSAVASRNHDYCQFRREEGKKKRASGHDPISNCPISRLRALIRDPEKDFLNFLNEQPRSSTSMCPKHVRQQSHDAAIATINIDFSPIARRTRSHSYSFSSLALRSSLPFVFLAFTKKNNVEFGAASHSSFRNFASVSLALVSAPEKTNGPICSANKITQRDQSPLISIPGDAHSFCVRVKL